MDDFTDLLMLYPPYGGDEVTLWNSGKKAILLGGVFYNTTVSHALDFDDTYWAAGALQHNGSLCDIAGYTKSSVVVQAPALSLRCAKKRNKGQKLT